MPVGYWTERNRNQSAGRDLGQRGRQCLTGADVHGKSSPGTHHSLSKMGEGRDCPPRRATDPGADRSEQPAGADTRSLCARGRCHCLAWRHAYLCHAAPMCANRKHAVGRLTIAANVHAVR